MFVKGQSGNPSGRQALAPGFKRACQDLARTALAALEKALTVPGERVPAAALVLAYGYGKPVARIDHRVIRSPADLSDEELSAILASGEETETSGELVH